MSFQLLEDRIAVVADEVQETTDSGLYVPETAQEPLRYGTIAAVGTGTWSETVGGRIPMDVKEGDRVFFNRHSGSTLEIEDTEYLCLSSREIIGIVKSELSVVDADD